MQSEWVNAKNYGIVKTNGSISSKIKKRSITNFKALSGGLSVVKRKESSSVCYRRDCSL